MFTKTTAAVSALVAVFVLTISQAAYAVYDVEPVTDGIEAQIAASLPTVLLVAGGILALFVIWKLIRRMTGA